MPREAITPIVRFAVNRPVTVGMATLGVLVLGWISLTRLPLEYLPTFSSSSISVNAPYPSSSPQEVERLIVRPLEDSLSTINGIDTLSATASASNAGLEIFDISSCRGCRADIDGDGDVDGEDFFAYLELFIAGDARADIDRDGDIDAEDFFGYLDLFVQGC